MLRSKAVPTDVPDDKLRVELRLKSGSGGALTERHILSLLPFGREKVHFSRSISGSTVSNRFKYFAMDERASKSDPVDADESTCLSIANAFC